MFSITMPNLFSFARFTIEAGDVVEEPGDPVSLNPSVLSVDDPSDPHVVSLEVPLRLPTSGLDFGRPAEVVA